MEPISHRTSYHFSVCLAGPDPEKCPGTPVTVRTIVRRGSSRYGPHAVVELTTQKTDRLKTKKKTKTKPDVLERLAATALLRAWLYQQQCLTKPVVPGEAPAAPIVLPAGFVNLSLW